MVFFLFNFAYMYMHMFPRPEVSDIVRWPWLGGNVTGLVKDARAHLLAHEQAEIGNIIVQGPLKEGTSKKKADKVRGPPQIEDESVQAKIGMLILHRMRAFILCTR